MSTAVATPIKSREVNNTRQRPEATAPQTRPTVKRPPSFLTTLLRTLSAFAA
jgi:hypothetical protein